MITPVESDEQDMEHRGMEEMNSMSSQEEPGMIAIPAFQTGWRV